MIAEGDTKMGICEFRIMRTRCNESSFDRIACDFRSRSLTHHFSEFCIYGGTF